MGIRTTVGIGRQHGNKSVSAPGIFYNVGPPRQSNHTWECPDILEHGYECPFFEPLRQPRDQQQIDNMGDVLGIGIISITNEMITAANGDRAGQAVSWGDHECSG